MDVSRTRSVLMWSSPGWKNSWPLGTPRTETGSGPCPTSKPTPGFRLIAPKPRSFISPALIYPKLPGDLWTRPKRVWWSWAMRLAFYFCPNSWPRARIISSWGKISVFRTTFRCRTTSPLKLHGSWTFWETHVRIKWGRRRDRTIFLFLNGYYKYNLCFTPLVMAEEALAKFPTICTLTERFEEYSLIMGVFGKF